MASFTRGGTIAQFQKFIDHIYGLPDDRLYSIWDLLIHQQRFAMRALKGIRKGDRSKLQLNLLISFSWLMAIGNRMHIDVEEEIWRRYPTLCSYCGERPCVCKKTRPAKRKKVKVDESLRPRKLADFQSMLEAIYPAEKRTLADAGVHLSEEMGEIGEAMQNFLGQHKSDQFDEIGREMADFVSCLFGVANSAGIDVAGQLAKMFHLNCHVCHQAPCVCSFSFVANIKT